jgi:DNA-binding MarR family transcriptional regulator
MSGIATSVIPLLSEWEKYMRDHPDGDVPGFAHWVLAQQPPKTTPTQTPNLQIPTTAQAGMLIARLHRIMSMLSKPKIKSLGFTKDLEFAVLVHVAIMDQPNKKELGRELLIENSTGVEITRRLAKKGLIIEKPDPNDRRSARLSLTEKGKKILMDGADWFRVLHTSFFNALEPEEKEQLLGLLNRLNQYHTGKIIETVDFLQ